MSYTYSATIQVVFRADSLDTAYRTAKRLADVTKSDEAVDSAVAPLVDLHHRPDLDGSLRSRRGEL